MSESPDNKPGEIYRAVCSVMREIEPIAKTESSKGYGEHYQYRGIVALMNALSPMLAKHGIFCASTLLSSQTEDRATRSGGSMRWARVRMRHRFFAGDGSSVEVEREDEAFDPGDKAFVKAQSISYREACFKLFCIPYANPAEDSEHGEQPEPAPHRHPEATSSAVPQPPAPTAPKPAPPPAARQTGRFTLDTCVLTQESPPNARKPWKLRTVRMTSGEEFGLFSDSLAQLCEDLIASGEREVEIEWTQGPKDTRIETLRALAAAAPPAAGGESLEELTDTPVEVQMRVVEHRGEKLQVFDVVCPEGRIYHTANRKLAADIRRTIREKPQPIRLACRRRMDGKLEVVNWDANPC